MFRMIVSTVLASSAWLSVYAGTTVYEPDNATHTYTTLGIYTISCVAINAIGNTTIQYVVVVQIPVSPNFVLNSSAPVILTAGNDSGKRTS